MQRASKTTPGVRPAWRIVEKEHVAEASLALCDHGRLAVVEGATHWLHLERPERIDAEVLAFLAESGRASPRAATR